MSIWVSVESITTPQSRYTSGPVERYLRRQVWLNAICKEFNWQSPLWSEPSEDQGLSTSIGNGGYSILLSLAWTIENLEHEPTQHIPQLIRIIEETRRSPSEHQYPELRNTCKIFPHLLDRDVYRSFYLPIDFSTPIHININWGVQSESKSFTDSLSVASSFRLSEELNLLCPILKSIVSLRGHDTHVPAYETYSWGSVYEACLTLMDASSDSLRLNLPVLILW